MGKGKKKRSKLNKDKKEFKAQEKNLNMLEQLKQKAKSQGFQEWDRLPGLNSFTMLNSLSNT